MDGVGEATGVNAVHKAGHYAYDLYHTVHTGWGYVYMVSVECGALEGPMTGGPTCAADNDDVCFLPGRLCWCRTIAVSDEMPHVERRTQEFTGESWFILRTPRYEQRG